MRRLDGGRGTAELGNNGVEQLHPNQTALLTERTEIDEAAGKLVKEGLPIGRRGGQQEGGRIDLQQLAAAGDFVFDVAIGEPAEVADSDEA